MAGRQLDLFGPQPGDLPKVGKGPQPPELHADVVDIAGRVPAGIRLGTSSWSFPGWQGIVYRDRHSAEVLARRGLAAYAQHPLLQTVGLDRTFYAPISASEFRRYADAVPDGFRFLVKAHEACTTFRFSRHPRYGQASGSTNSRFLDAAYAEDHVVGPATEGLAERCGPILFQFPPQSAADLGGPAAFALRLHSFLGCLPRGPLYAVEIRTPALMTSDYFAALRAASATHCLTVHPTMPALGVQAAMSEAAGGPATVIRWMLHYGYAYEEAKEKYQPFDRLVEEAPAIRQTIADLCLDATHAGRPAYVIVNNKAEGSAPLSVFELAKRIAESSR